MISLSISQRVDGKWQVVDLGQFGSGQALADAMVQMDGQEYVAEWKNDGARAMACGLEKHADAYRKKGDRVLTFPELISGLSGTTYLDDIVSEVNHPLIQKAREVFDAPLSTLELELNREERVAYMVQDKDVTEDQAQKFCDTKPETYGNRKEK